jgi:hypothetical protein
MFRELLEKNRSYRTFDESVRIDRNTLLSLVELTRRTPAPQCPGVIYFLSCDAKPTP